LNKPDGEKAHPWQLNTVWRRLGDTIRGSRCPAHIQLQS